MARWTEARASPKRSGARRYTLNADDGAGFPTQLNGCFATAARPGSLCIPRLQAVSASARDRDPGRGGAVGRGGVAGLFDHASRHRPGVHGAGAVFAGADFSAAGGPCGRPLRPQARDPDLLRVAGVLHGRADRCWRATTRRIFLLFTRCCFLSARGARFRRRRVRR